MLVNGDANNPDEFISLVAPANSTFSNVLVEDNPDPNGENDPQQAGINFPVGFVNFNLENLTPGQATTIRLLVPEENDYNTYWKNDANLGWYEFNYDGSTGAQFIDSNDNGQTDQVLLHFIDGQRGDNGQTADGVIVDPGAPGINNTPLTLNAENKILTLSGNAGSTNLQFKLIQDDRRVLHEVGVFRVDGDNRVNGIAPDEAGYRDAALGEADVLFSSLNDRSNNLIAGLEFSRQLQFSAGDRLAFYFIPQQTADAILNNPQTSTPVFFSFGDALNLEENNQIFTLKWQDGQSDSFFDLDNFDDLVMTVEVLDTPLGLSQLIANSQGGEEGELIDLRQFVGQQVATEFPLVRSEAAFNNIVGFYQIENEQGAVINPVNDQLLNPGDAGYTEAAVRRSQEAGDGITLVRNGSGTMTDLDGGFLYAPFIIANGTVAQILDNDPSNDAPVYFTFLGANPDGVDHIRLLADNIFGFEDLPGGGDLDYNDIIVQTVIS